MIDLSRLDLNAPEAPAERIEVPQPLQLATTRYQNWRESSGYLPVGVTVGRPRFVRYDFVAVPVLAPHELMKGRFKGIDNIEIERKIYRERLRVREPEILAALEELARKYPDVPAALMCFEDVNAGLDCHRRWAAEWFGQRFGWDVPELPNPAGVAPARPTRPKAPEPPTLF
ncbi:DUF488 domain-containing protein [Streptomyces sp. TR1341]|uniref:DUF488 domain-containing protein n=1 Tax=Streptomyces sp. TR1341 TaxID=2601266 RepID=UPI00138ACC71|nr:DUF488 domain-containing protein [Streptomyces sp. TR1341]